MKGVKSPRGYTLIEVLIVLAVSGVMFVIAVNFIGGKQKTTAFNTGTNELASQIQDVITSVTDGQYSDYPIVCQRDPITKKVTFSAPPSGVETQGQNSQCVFLGKFINFDISDSNSIYKINSLAGLKAVDTDGTPPADYNEAKPKVIDDLTITKPIPQSLDIYSVSVNGTPSKKTFGFLQSISSGGSLGAQQPPKFVYLNSNGTVNANDKGNPQINGGNLSDASQAYVCLSDGTNYSKITIGLNGGAYNVRTQMLGKNPGSNC